jgi:hypothetical protein
MAVKRGVINVSLGPIPGARRSGGPRARLRGARSRTFAASSNPPGEDHGNCDGWRRGHAEGWDEALALHECPDGLTEVQEQLLREASSLAQDGHDAWREVKTLRRRLADAKTQLDSRNGRVGQL